MIDKNTLEDILYDVWKVFFFSGRNTKVLPSLHLWLREAVSLIKWGWFIDWESSSSDCAAAVVQAVLRGSLGGWFERGSGGGGSISWGTLWCFFSLS